MFWRLGTTQKSSKRETSLLVEPKFVLKRKICMAAKRKLCRINKSRNASNNDKIEANVEPTNGALVKLVDGTVNSEGATLLNFTKST